MAWSGLPVWRVLETRFGLGQHFLSLWQRWRDDPQRPQRLHCVCITDAPPSLGEILGASPDNAQRQALACELEPHWRGLLPGFHRINLDGGRFILTLCVGDTTAMLREQQFLADAVVLPDEVGASPLWDIWAIKALARCCRRGTSLTLAAGAPVSASDLRQCGFETSQPEVPQHWLFNPRWALKNTRNSPLTEAPQVGRCAIIGAGLAGASVAAALAQRGWQVQVFDEGAAPASGASGLPVGLVVPHVSADDCALSRLSRAGVRLMLQQARSLLQKGQDWDATGVLERRLDGSRGVPAEWPQAGRDGCEPCTFNEAPAVWHSQAAWLKPAHMVRAWLAQPGVVFQGRAKVASLQKLTHGWALLDEAGRELGRADRVVFANAGGAAPLLNAMQATLPAGALNLAQLPAMHGMRGQLSWGKHTSQASACHAFPAFPVNGSGSVIPWIPLDTPANGTPEQTWFVGSSYQPEHKPELADASNHQSNLAHLQQLLPTLGQALGQTFEKGDVNTWKSTRCVTLDRLPLVGPLNHEDHASLWICAGMGSRGLTFSVLCAELLAARWGNEPWPVSASLAQSLNALRGRATKGTPVDSD